MMNQILILLTFGLVAPVFAQDLTLKHGDPIALFSTAIENSPMVGDCETNIPVRTMKARELRNVEVQIEKAITSSRSIDPYVQKTIISLEIAPHQMDMAEIGSDKVKIKFAYQYVAGQRELRSERIREIESVIKVDGLRPTINSISVKTYSKKTTGLTRAEAKSGQDIWVEMPGLKLNCSTN